MVIECGLTLSSHAHFETFLEPTVLALVSVVLVDGAVPVSPAGVGEVPSDAPLEEALTPFASKLAVVLATGLVPADHAFDLLAPFVRAGRRARLLRGRGGHVRRFPRLPPRGGRHGQGHRRGGRGGGGGGVRRPAFEAALPGAEGQGVESPQLQGRWGRPGCGGPLRNQQLSALVGSGLLSSNLSFRGSWYLLVKGVRDAPAVDTKPSSNKHIIRRFLQRPCAMVEEMDPLN